MRRAEGNAVRAIEDRDESLGFYVQRTPNFVQGTTQGLPPQPEVQQTRLDSSTHKHGMAHGNLSSQITPFHGGQTSNLFLVREWPGLAQPLLPEAELHTTRARSSGVEMQFGNCLCHLAGAL